MSDRRKIYFIKKRFQARFILGFCILILLESMAIGAILYYLVNNILTENIYVSHLKIKTTGELVAPIVMNVNVIVAIITLVIAVMLSFIITAGVERHLLRFKDAANSVKEGDMGLMLTPEYHDLIDELSRCFNFMLSRLGEKINALKVDFVKIEENLETAEELLKKGKTDMEGFEAISRSLSESCMKFEKDMEWFKVER